VFWRGVSHPPQAKLLRSKFRSYHYQYRSAKLGFSCVNLFKFTGNLRPELRAPLCAVLEKRVNHMKHTLLSSEPQFSTFKINSSLEIDLPTRVAYRGQSGL